MAGWTHSVSTAVLASKYTGRMPASSETPQKKLTIREAFPALPEEKVKEAEARVDRYVALVYRIYERIREDPEQYDSFKLRLTELSSNDSMDSSGERGSPEVSSP